MLGFVCEVNGIMWFLFLGLGIIGNYGMFKFGIIIIRMVSFRILG